MSNIYSNINSDIKMKNMKITTNDMSNLVANIKRQVYVDALRKMDLNDAATALDNGKLITKSFTIDLYRYTGTKFVGVSPTNAESKFLESVFNKKIIFGIEKSVFDVIVKALTVDPDEISNVQPVPGLPANDENLVSMFADGQIMIDAAICTKIDTLTIGE